MNNQSNNIAVSQQQKPFKVKIVLIVGLTKNQRDLELKKIIKLLEHIGWIFIKHDETSRIKGAIDGSSAEFHRLVKPSIKQSIFDWYFDRKLKIWLSVFGIIIILIFVGLSKISKKADEENQINAALRGEQYKREQQQKIQLAKSAAESLKNFLRNKGVNEALIIDVNVDSFGMIYLIVANSWLQRPKYEQKQMKQTIELALKKIAPPDGFPFYLMDFMGNRI